MSQEPLPTPVPSSPTGFVTLADLVAQWGIAGSTLRSAIRSDRRPRGWLPAPEATVGKAAVWRPEQLTGLQRPERGSPRGITETKPRARRHRPAETPPPSDQP
ncbi:MAG: hypothetical protein HGA44_10800 [Cellulomonadaceae bacterium]|nr:hypothetical protein [Cellulomonadaceae bacterium]